MNITSEKKLFLNNNNACVLVCLAEIIRCESKGSYTTFFFANHEKFTVTKTIKKFDYLLTPFGFIRTHQSHLVNAFKIKKFDKDDGQKIIMENGDFVPVSQRRKERLIMEMKNQEIKTI